MAVLPTQPAFQPIKRLPKGPVSRDQLIIYNEADGANSLIQMIDDIRKNMSYHQARKAIRRGLSPATKYLARKLKEEIPKSKRSFNIDRPSGATAESVRARLGAPPGRGAAGQAPIGRVVLVPPHGYVYNFMKGTGPRRAAIISKAQKIGLWKEFGRGVGGWGLGPSRGSMPKIFDIDQFMNTHRDTAIAILILTFQRLVNAHDFSRQPKAIREIPDGTDLT